MRPVEAVARALYELNPLGTVSWEQLIKHRSAYSEEVEECFSQARAAILALSQSVSDEMVGEFLGGFFEAGGVIDAVNGGRDCYRRAIAAALAKAGE